MRPNALFALLQPAVVVEHLLAEEMVFVISN